MHEDSVIGDWWESTPEPVEGDTYGEKKSFSDKGFWEMFGNEAPQSPSPPNM